MCLPCTLKNDGSNRAVLEDQSEHGTERGAIKCFTVGGHWSIFGFCRQASVLNLMWAATGCQQREHSKGVMWEGIKKLYVSNK